MRASWARYQDERKFSQLLSQVKLLEENDITSRYTLGKPPHLLTNRTYVYCREVAEIETKLDAMEENSRQVNLLERQQVDAQAQVDRAEKELNEAELIRDIDRAKFASPYEKRLALKPNYRYC